MESKGDPAGPMSHPALRVPAVQSLRSMLCVCGGEVKVVPKAVLQNNNLSWKPSQLGFPPQRPSAGLGLIAALQPPRPPAPPTTSPGDSANLPSPGGTRLKKSQCQITQPQP